MSAHRVPGRVADELHVDLEEIDRQVLEVAEPAVARTEVVEGEFASEGTQPVREVAGRGVVLDQQR
jgi:hypothetical protein